MENQQDFLNEDFHSYFDEIFLFEVYEKGNSQLEQLQTMG